MPSSYCELGASTEERDQLGLRVRIGVTLLHKCSSGEFPILLAALPTRQVAPFARIHTCRQAIDEVVRRKVGAYRLGGTAFTGSRRRGRRWALGNLVGQSRGQEGSVEATRLPSWPRPSRSQSA